MSFSLRPFDLGAKPPDEKKVPELVIVPAADALEGIIACERLYELPCHWIGNNTVLCTGDPETCEHHEYPAKWYALLALYQRSKQRYIWVRLTSQAVYALQDCLNGSDRIMGRTCRIQRERKSLKAPITMWVDDLGLSTVTRGITPQTPEDTIARVFKLASSSVKKRRKAV